MANFKPLKQRFIQCLDDGIKKHAIQGKFLDFGCGQADIAKHVITEYGSDIDLLEVAPKARNRIKKDSVLSQLQLFSAIEEIHDECYSLIIAFDVLEHLPNPVETLKKLRCKITRNGYIAVIVPYRPECWGWDDEFYGHLRRWSKAETLLALESSGFCPIKVIDPTYPFYRLFRYCMLKRAKPLRYWESKQGTKREVYQQRSELSSQENAWGKPPIFIKIIPWRAINFISRLFENTFKGDEIFLLCKKI